MPALDALVAVGLTSFIVLALARASRHVALLFIATTGAAAALAFGHGRPGLLVDGLGRVLVFGAFLPAILLLRATVNHAGAARALRDAVAGLGPQGRIAWVLHGAHVLGAILNVGAMAILAPIAARNADDRERATLAAAAVRGTGIGVMWSPFFVALAFVAHLLPQVHLAHAMLLGAGLSVVGLVLSHMMFTPALGARALADALARLAPLALPAAVIVGAVVALGTLTRLGGLQAVALATPVLCAGYLVARARPSLPLVARDTFASFAKMADELIIVTGATVLGTVVAGTAIVTGLGSVPHGPLAALTIIAVLVAVLVLGGVAGLHPMIGASVLVPLLAAGRAGVADVVLVEAAVLAWGLSATIAVWTMPVAVAASLFGVRVRTLGGGPNIRFTALYLVAGVAYLWLANAWLHAR